MEDQTELKKAPDAHDDAKQQEPSNPPSPTPASDNKDVEERNDEAQRKLDESIKRYADLRHHKIRLEDAIDPNAERVHKLEQFDIVFGRGKWCQRHPGNIRMRKVTEKYKLGYHEMTRAEKRVLVEKVYEEIVADGARFLKKLDGEETYVVVDVPIALQKVSHTLRCRKAFKKAFREAEERNSFSLGITRTQGIKTSSNIAAAAAVHGLAPSLIGGGGMSSLYPQYPTFQHPLMGSDPSNLASLSNQNALGLFPMTNRPNYPQADYLTMLRQQQAIRESMLLEQLKETNVANPGK